MHNSLINLIKRDVAMGEVCERGTGKGVVFVVYRVHSTIVWWAGFNATKAWPF